MLANRPIKKIKKNDLVKVISGSDKGKTGKVLSVSTKHQAVFIEGVGMRKRHVRPNQMNPRGGTKDVHVPVAINKVALVVDEKKGVTSRVGMVKNADGGKTRVARALKNKEIK